LEPTLLLETSKNIKFLEITLMAANLPVEKIVGASSLTSQSYATYRKQKQTFVGKMTLA
jgi:hypothetical protein